jgi:hypothetical protein
MSLQGTIVICLVIPALVVLAITSKTKLEVGAFPGIPDTEDSKLIQEKIRQSYKIEGEAAVTFDTSDFSLVFIDDSRGTELSSSQLKFVQDITQQTSKTYFGYLTYKKSYYSWWGKGEIAMEELQIKAEDEKRAITKEEMQSLIVSSSGMMPPARAESMGGEPELMFIAIAIDGDQSVATFDDGLRTNEMTLVKVDENWLIAGNKILALHP